MRANRFCCGEVSRILYTTLVIKDWDHWNKMLPKISETHMKQVKTLIIGHPLPNPPWRGQRPKQTTAKTNHFRAAAVAPPKWRGRVDVVESNDFVEWSTASVVLDMWVPRAFRRWLG